MTLRVHSAFYLAAGALETGLFVACARSLAGQSTGDLPPLVWVAAVAAAAGWAVLATDPGAPRSGTARVPQLLLATLAVFALGKALQAGLWAALGERVAGDPGVAAVLRTAVLAALALALAVACPAGDVAGAGMARVPARRARRGQAAPAGPEGWAPGDAGGEPRPLWRRSRPGPAPHEARRGPAGLSGAPSLR